MESSNKKTPCNSHIELNHMNQNGSLTVWWEEQEHVTDKQNKTNDSTQMTMAS